MRTQGKPRARIYYREAGERQLVSAQGQNNRQTGLRNYSCKGAQLKPHSVMEPFILSKMRVISSQLVRPKSWV